MALSFVCQLGVAAALLVFGVSMGLQSRSRVESPTHLTARLVAIVLAAVLFFLYVGESMGFGPSLETVFQGIGLRAERLWETGSSLFWSAF
jgi:hypothetical protein